jgi:hypothetical protein
MPKVRDLGISFIPATMRPLEIGDGAGSTPQCEPSGVCKDPSCHEPSFDNCDPSGCGKGVSTCHEPSSYDDCEPRSTMPCDPSGCGKGPTVCFEPSTDDSGGGGKKDKTEQILSAASIAQLKQQLQSRLGA